MRRSAAFLLALLPSAAATRAQAPAAGQQLQPIDMFRLDYLMVAEAEEPRGWIDAERYLVFDAGPRGMRGRDAPRWQAVNGRSGAREAWVERGALVHALRELKVDAAALAALDDAAAWTWSDDHARFVVNLGNDLFAGARDGAPVRLTATPDDEEVGVRFSPDGAMVAFVARHDLCVVPFAGGDVRELTDEGHDDLFFGRLDWVYQEELYGRGNFQGYWWSPDSQRIAVLRLDESPVQDFVLVPAAPARPVVESTKYPKVGEANPIADLGVVDVATGAKRWFDLAAYPPADRLIVRVTWAPDAKAVLLQVQGREQRWLDMLAGDAATGAVCRLWREDSDCWVESGPEPVFVDGGAQFLWLSERDGFRHVYRYDRDGTAKGRLTSGEWQVKDIAAVDEARGEAYVVADKDGPLGAWLYAVPLAGGEPRRITHLPGTHEIAMAPDHATFLDNRSDARTPPTATLRDLADAELRAVATPRVQMLKPYATSEPEFVQVPTRDGFAMEAMVLKPVGYEEGRRYPVVQYVYGGPHTPIVRDQWGSRDLLWHQMLAERGYLVFLCDNRSASGKGRRFAKACFREPGQSELKDLEDGVDWLVQQGLADPERIAVWGWSYGGYQTLYNLTHSTKWKCGVAVNAVTDWRNYDSIYTERYFGLPAANADGYERGSAVAAAGNLHGALMLIAAALDDNVHMQNSLQFLHAMQEAGKDCDFMVYPGVRHGIEDLQQQVHLFARFLRFLEEKL